MPNVLLKCVTQSGYSVGYKSGVISQELDGGAPRYRRNIKNAYHTVNVQWVVQESGFQYLDALYNVWCENPNEFFYAPLKVNGPEYKNYESYFVEDSFQLNSVEGLVFTCTAQLRVKPIVDSELNKIIVESGSQGIDLSDLFNPLEKLVNVDLPNALRGLN
ncbi:hypothetical protein [Acinetobacter gerneri]|uniref:Uncharacterized protein n=1 Tax=Acinetobacter gerneri DSM 14967 = CIP 107464 = MTCC 9824 TaxID=1120926 RepID=N8ZS69_9GAMM|nr:hypothetical protein [Acinetobacter gerneri]ENV34563.1 hypothetical protein F960_01301 [Acinetobacter gerneri DSM 14967 = CIP 107464 = MTCC 9824]EPR82884.1 hypothetical protein L289_2609 [Acinetobacter gerneri DSM 14967 = CIP 107464 = MTCC 9824]